MEPKVHTYVLNVILAFVPDLVVAWAAMRLTDSGWSGFWITLLVLQAIYFFFWFKQALWGWLLFWIIGKRQMARYLENSFIESRFPPPDEYTLEPGHVVSVTIDGIGTLVNTVADASERMNGD